MKINNRTTYLALVHKDDESAWGISFPDLQGCFSAADDEDDIITNAMEALELYAEDLDILPEPRSISTIATDPYVAGELAQGSYLISIPFIRNTQRTTRVNITLSKGLLDAIDAEATRRKLTRSGFIAQASEREIAG